MTVPRLEAIDLGLQHIGTSSEAVGVVLPHLESGEGVRRNVPVSVEDVPVPHLLPGSKHRDEVEAPVEMLRRVDGEVHGVEFESDVLARGEDVGGGAGVYERSACLRLPVGVGVDPPFDPADGLGGFVDVVGSDWGCDGN